MKHSITSYNTKRLMADSLKKAMKTKPLSKITVTEIVKDCGINRNTFYYHFQDIYELLKWMLEEEAIETMKHYDLLADSEEAINFIMDYVEKNDHILNCAYNTIGNTEMKRFFYTNFIELVKSVIEQCAQESHVTLEPNFKQFLCRFYTEALAGLLIEWMQNRETRNRKETVRYICFTLKTSISAVLMQSPKLFV